LGVTTHTGSITITPGHTYWVTGQANHTTALASLAVYDPSNNCAQVGSSITTAPLDTGGQHGTGPAIGNNSGGSQAGQTSYFEKFVLDTTNATWPIPCSGVASLEQEGFRFRNDDGSETTATWVASQDVNATMALSTNKRLRMLINSTLDEPTITYQLEYKKSTDSVYSKVLTAAAGPTFQAAGTAVGGTSTVNIDWPTHQADDIGLLTCETAGGQPATLTDPMTFLAVTNSPQATGVTTAGTQITVWWARAFNSTMPTVRVADAGDHTYCVITTYRGVINHGTPWDITAGSVKAGATTTTTFDAVTTTVPNTLIVNIASRDTDSAAAAWSGWTNATTGAPTEQFDAGTTSGNGGGIGIATAAWATTGSSGATTATVSSSINAEMTIALKPNPANILITTSANIASSAATATTAQLAAPRARRQATSPLAASRTIPIPCPPSTS